MHYHHGLLTLGYRYYIIFVFIFGNIKCSQHVVAVILVIVY